MLITTSKIIAHLTEPTYLFILILVISAILYFYPFNLKTKTHRLARKRSAILLVTASITTALTIKILKEIIQSPRPLDMLIQETGYSFPSGHTTFAVVFFGLLVCIFTKTKKQKIIYSILATLIIITIALSRLILQVHHPADIIAGLIIGSIILTSSILIHKKLPSK